MINKKTLVLGASDNPHRYANIAVRRLTEKGHSVVTLGIRKGQIEGIEINLNRNGIHNIDTVTLYINPTIQKQYYDYIIQLKPKRIIFNPGTENRELQQLAEENGIETVYACTLVMLSNNSY